MWSGRSPPRDGPAYRRGPPAPVGMELQGALPGTVNGYRYTAVVPADRPANHYTPRIAPWHPDALVPLENSHLYWQH